VVVIEGPPVDSPPPEVPDCAGQKLRRAAGDADAKTSNAELGTHIRGVRVR
jgi:hypothetical protein